MLLLGIWVIGAFGGSSRSSAPAAGPIVAEDEVTPVDDGRTGPAEESTGGAGVTSGQLGSGGDDAGETVIASSLLAALDTDALVSFLAGTTTTTIDLATGVVTTAQIGTHALYDLGDYTILNDGGRAVAIRSGDPSDAVLIGSVGEVVAGDAYSYTLVTTREEGEEIYVGGVLEGFTRILAAPAGSGRVSVPGLGVLVTPPTGGTFLATVQGYAPFSTGRVVAATPDASLEIRCDDQLVCEAVLVRPGGLTPVDLSFVDTDGTLLLSPDGVWIVRSDEEGTILYEVDGGMTRELSVMSQSLPQWAPDSSFLVWLDGGEAPALEFSMVGTDPEATFRVGLSSLGDHLEEGGGFLVHR